MVLGDSSRARGARRAAGGSRRRWMDGDRGPVPPVPASVSPSVAAGAELARSGRGLGPHRAGVGASVSPGPVPVCGGWVGEAPTCVCGRRRQRGAGHVAPERGPEAEARAGALRVRVAGAGLLAVQRGQAGPALVEGGSCGGKRPGPTVTRRPPPAPALPGRSPKPARPRSPSGRTRLRARARGVTPRRRV